MTTGPVACAKMDAVFVDDSVQRRPSRPGMNKQLVAVGGLHVAGEAIKPLERGLDELCLAVGFPKGQEFKWSPGRRDWMRRALMEESRSGFLARALRLAKEAGATAFVVVEDTGSSPAIGTSSSATHDAVSLFLERANNLCRGLDRVAIVVVDRPGGDRQSEYEFVSGCLDTIRDGTDFVQFDRLTLVLTGDSRHLRLLQLADVVTACVLAYVSGEERFAPAVFAHVAPLLRSDSGRVGGVGVKIHPDLRYVNLYHWLLGDTFFKKGGGGIGLPATGRPYASSPNAA